MEQETETVTSLFSQLNRLRIQKHCYYDLKSICEKIEKLIRNRPSDRVISAQNANYVQATSGLSYTINKEVNFIKSHQDRMHKKMLQKFWPLNIMRLSIKHTIVFTQILCWF